MILQNKIYLSLGVSHLSDITLIFNQVNYPRHRLSAPRWTSLGIFDGEGIARAQFSAKFNSAVQRIRKCSAVKIGARSSLCSACCHSTAVQFRSLQWWISLLCTLPAGAPWQSFNPVSRWRLTSHQIDGSQFKILQYTQVTHYLEQVPLLHIKLYHFVLSSKLHRFCWFQKLVTIDVLKEAFNPLMALTVGVNP